MEYKNMREVYKGNIWKIRTPNFIGSDRFGDYRFKFDETMVIGSNEEYMFIKDGCYLYEIISSPKIETILSISSLVSTFLLTSILSSPFSSSLIYMYFLPLLIFFI